MNITLDELFKGKATRIKDATYRETEAYVTPFLERINKLTDKVTVNVELPKQVTITKHEDLNFDDVTYNRVWVQAELPQEYQVENHIDVIGMVYGLDVRKPLVKFYRGGLNMACTNLCVFDPSYLSVQEMAADKAVDYRPVDRLIEQANEIKQFLDMLNTRVLSYEELRINEALGQWVRRSLWCTYDNGLSKAKLSTTSVIDSFKLLYTDSKSDYYVNPGSETTYFNIYNAFTDIISHHDKDIMNKCEKILLLKNILGLN